MTNEQNSFEEETVETPQAGQESNAGIVETTTDPIALAAKKKQQKQMIQYVAAGGGILLLLATVAYGAFSGSSTEDQKVSIESSSVTTPKGNTTALSSEEAKRRAEADSVAAEAARRNDGSFLSNTTTGAIANNASFGIAPASVAPVATDITSDMNARPTPYMSIPQASATNVNLPDPMQGVNAAIESRDKSADEGVQKYFEFLTKTYLTAEKTQDSGYARVSYLSKQKNNDSASVSSTNQGASTTVPMVAKAKPAIRAGSSAFAILDNAINTDSGSTEVIATVIGGEYNGSRLLGQIKQGQGNFAIVFNTLAPQDGRDTLNIYAIAMRAEDMSQGMADSINNHTFSRYTSLAVASLLSGYGKVASQVSGTTVSTSTATITTTDLPTDRQTIAGALGELGSNASSEIRRGFDRVPTYKTNAGAQFVVVFLKDSSVSGQAN